LSAWNSNGLTVNTVTTTTDAIDPTDDVIIYTNTAAKTATLPAVATVPKGKVYHISNQATGTVTISPAAGTIDGAATLVVAATTGRATLVSDGANWFTINLA
jgi:hypothetical protein